MSPCCAVVCLVLGLGGILLFVVGFSLPYWFQDDTNSVGTSSHGLWQTRQCDDIDCSLNVIKFGVSAEFESARVFSCATIGMGLVSFIFTIVLVQKPHRKWCIRTSAMWGCTGVFNLLVVALFGATEKDTLKELAIPGVDPDRDITPLLGWCFWVTVASLALFILITLCCAVLSCTDEVDESESGSKLPLTSRKSRAAKVIDEMQADRLARFQPHSLYPVLPVEPAPYPTPSIATTRKSAEVFPPQPESTYPSTYNQPSVYSVNKASDGYTIQPSRAAANIDNRPRRLTALDTPYYPSSAASDYSTTERVILNRPAVPMSNTSTASGPVTLSVPKHGTPYGESVYSLNLRNPIQDGRYGNLPVSNMNGFAVAPKADIGTYALNYTPNTGNNTENVHAIFQAVQN